MTRLPDGLQSLLSLRYSKDASIGSISRHLGKSASAVKFQLFAIRRKLRECVNRKIAMGQG
jgi:DNA-directed RNA polymerase specialized sigma24 family protein